MPFVKYATVHSTFEVNINFDKYNLDVFLTTLYQDNKRRHMPARSYLFQDIKKLTSLGSTPDHCVFETWSRD
jgi:hypothetical protein